MKENDVILKTPGVQHTVQEWRYGHHFQLDDMDKPDYRHVPVAGFLCRPLAHIDMISAPIHLLPPEMQDVQVKDIAGSDLYCLSFKKPL
jgi:hypothetical protein